jgi:hypothetical protein
MWLNKYYEIGKRDKHASMAQRLATEPTVYTHTYACTPKHKPNCHFSLLVWISISAIYGIKSIQAALSHKVMEEGQFRLASRLEVDELEALEDGLGGGHGVRVREEVELERRLHG